MNTQTADTPTANTQAGALVDEHAAAKELAVAVATLRNWRWRGIGPRYVKLGKLVRYRPDDLRAFIASCEVQA